MIGSPFPAAAGIWIAMWAPPAPPFAGTPGAANCAGKSVSALAATHGTIDAAVAALGYATVQGLQDAIKAFCRP